MAHYIICTVHLLEDKFRGKFIECPGRVLAIDCFCQKFCGPRYPKPSFVFCFLLQGRGPATGRPYKESLIKECHQLPRPEETLCLYLVLLANASPCRPGNQKQKAWLLRPRGPASISMGPMKSLSWEFRKPECLLLLRILPWIL